MSFMSHTRMDRYALEGRPFLPINAKTENTRPAVLWASVWLMNAGTVGKAPVATMFICKVPCHTMDAEDEYDLGEGPPFLLFYASLHYHDNGISIKDLCYQGSLL